MNFIFTDTFYLIALTDPKDDWHDRARTTQRMLKKTDLLFVTYGVLQKFLNSMAQRGRYLRQRGIDVVLFILNSPQFVLIDEPERELFQQGFDLYQSRPDKGYSLTDCISMTVMKSKGIRDVLTNDRHFEQEGFVCLLR